MVKEEIWFLEGWKHDLTAGFWFSGKIIYLRFFYSCFLSTFLAPLLFFSRSSSPFLTFLPISRLYHVSSIRGRIIPEWIGRKCGVNTGMSCPAPLLFMSNCGIAVDSTDKTNEWKEKDGHRRRIIIYTDFPCTQLFIKNSMTRIRGIISLPTRWRNQTAINDTNVMSDATSVLSCRCLDGFPSPHFPAIHSLFQTYYPGLNFPSLCEGNKSGRWCNSKKKNRLR